MIAILLSSKDFRTRDIYIDYAFDKFKFRWEKDTEKVYRRQYGNEEEEVHHSDETFNEAIAAGKEITRDEYYAG